MSSKLSFKECPELYLAIFFAFIAAIVCTFSTINFLDALENKIPVTILAAIIGYVIGIRMFKN